MKLFVCNGYWIDNKENFQDMVVSDGYWNGVEDYADEKIFYYTDGDSVIGDHGEFVITNAKEYA